MPELPEVETVVRSLAPIIGQNINHAQVYQHQLRIGSKVPTDFESRIQDSTVLDIRRIAKYIVINLSNFETIIVHLGMSGNLLMKEITHKAGKHEHVEIALTKNKLIYYDPRRFGLVDIIKTDNISNYFKKKKIGIDALSEDFNEDYLSKIISKSNTVIKQLLLNQEIVAGLGNIYVCEALYSAKIHPNRISKTLSVREVKSLVKSIKEILRRSILQGGTTLKDYKDATGSPGYFVQELDVYGKTNLPCSKCKGKIERIIISGRSTFFCKKCQK